MKEVLESGGGGVRLETSADDNELRFRTFVELAPDGIVITDANGHITIVNAQAEAMFGYRREELVGRPVEVLLPESLRGRHRDHRDGYVSAPRTRSMGAGLPLLGRRKDGREFPVAVSLSPVDLPSGLLIFSSVRDITDQRRFEQEIHKLNHHLERRTLELEAVNHELEAFSYSVSHDLRAPLRALDGFSRIVLKEYDGQLDDTGREYLARIRNAAQRMGTLIDDLLRLSRVTRTDMQHVDVDLSRMVASLLGELQAKEPERVVEVAVEPDLSVVADPDLLRVMLDNLVANAWKFSSRRAVARIEFGVEIQGSRPVYRLRDNGAGFDMRYADKLFNPFQRLHDMTEFPGTGIGLATVQRIVSRHGGRIWAESQVGRGTSFYFTLG